MASFPTSRAALIVFLVIFGVPTVVCIAGAMILGKPELFAMSSLFGVMIGVMLFEYPKRVMVTHDQICAEYFIRRRKSWPLASLTVTTFGTANGTILRNGLLRFYVGDSKKAVIQISHGWMEDQFEPLINELKSHGVRVAPRVPRDPFCLPRVEAEVDGKREVRYRGGRSVLFGSLAVCAIVAIGSFLVLMLSWGVPIAEREKLIVCCGVMPFALLAILFVPRGVMGVVFREDKVTIKRVWRRSLVLKRENIAALSARKSRLDESQTISLLTQSGERVTVSESALGSYPGELWKELEEFAGVEVAPPC